MGTRALHESRRMSECDPGTSVVAGTQPARPGVGPQGEFLQRPSHPWMWWLPGAQSAGAALGSCLALVSLPCPGGQEGVDTGSPGTPLCTCPSVVNNSSGGPLFLP